MNNTTEILERFRAYVRRAHRTEKQDLKTSLSRFLKEQIEIYRLAATACERSVQNGQKVDLYEYCLHNSRLVAFVELLRFIESL